MAKIMAGKGRKGMEKDAKPGKKAMVIIAIGKPKKGGMKKDCK